jgi:hypothetical protein
MDGEEVAFRAESARGGFEGCERGEYVRKAVKKLGSREGGLMLKHDLFPGVPLENIAALMDAMEMYTSELVISEGSELFSMNGIGGLPIHITEF